MQERMTLVKIEINRIPHFHIKLKKSMGLKTLGNKKE